MTRKSLDDGDDNDGKIQKKKFRLYKKIFQFIDLVFYFEIFDHLGNCTGKDKIYNYFKINIIDNYFFFYKEKLINIPLSFLYSKLSAIFKKKIYEKKEFMIILKNVNLKSLFIYTLYNKLQMKNIKNFSAKITNEYINYVTLKDGQNVEFFTQTMLKHTYIANRIFKNKGF